MLLYYMIAVVDRAKSELTASLFRQSGLSMISSALGRGTASRRQLMLLGLDGSEKSVVSGVADAEKARALFRSAWQQLSIDIPGNDIMMSVPLKSVAGRRTLQYLSDGEQKGGSPDMTFEHELIIAILNEGYSDLVMDAARSAGAGGGTVLHAKGTSTAQERRFFGVNLTEEKDIVYIVAHSDEKAAIMKAITEQAGPGSKAGAICFSLPISAVAGLRSRERDLLFPEEQAAAKEAPHDPAE